MVGLERMARQLERDGQTHVWQGQPATSVPPTMRWACLKHDPAKGPTLAWVLLAGKCDARGRQGLEEAARSKRSRWHAFRRCTNWTEDEKHPKL